MSTDQITEAVWQGNAGGFEGQLHRARKLETTGQALCAYTLYASAYYSHFISLLPWHPFRALYEFKEAKRYARLVSEYLQSSDRKEKIGLTLTHGQCDVVGTIFLRSWLWMRASELDREIANAFLTAGLMKGDVPPHAKALLTIGIAEHRYWNTNQFNSSGCSGLIKKAREFEFAVSAEKDLIQAQRQFTRVLRRAFRLYYLLGDQKEAREVYEQALSYARDPLCGSEDQLRKIRFEWRLLHLPKCVQALFPQ